MNNLLTVSITADQNTLISPLKNLEKKVSAVYQDCFQGVLSFDNMLQGKVQPVSNVLSDGKDMTHNLKRFLEACYKNNHLDELLDNNKLRELLKQRQSTHDSNQQLVQLGMSTDEAIYQEYEANKPNQPLQDPYQFQILENLHLLKWRLYRAWNQCLSEIHRHNRRPLPSCELPSIVSDSRIRENLLSVRTMDDLLKPLISQLNHYATIFDVTLLQSVVAEKLLPLTEQSKFLYRHAIASIKSMEGLPPQEYGKQLQIILNTIQQNIVQSVRNTQSHWNQLKVQEIGDYETSQKYAAYHIGLFHYLKNTQEHIFLGMPKPYFPSRSLSKSLQNILVITVEKMDKVIRELIYVFGKAIYFYNRAQSLSKLSRYFYTHLGMTDINAIRSPDFVKELESFGNSLIKECLVGCLNNILRKANEQSKHCIRIDSTGKDLLDSISAVRQELANSCAEVKHFLLKFNHDIQQNDSNILYSALSIEEQLNTAFELKACIAGYEKISSMMSVASNARPLPIDASVKVYWVNENIPTEQGVIDQVNREQIEALRQFPALNACHTNSMKITLHTMQHHLLKALIDLKGEGDNLFYQYIELSKSHRVLSDVRGNSNSAFQLLLKANQLKKYAYTHYMQLFDIKDNHRLVLINRYIDIKDTAYEFYNTVQNYQLHLLLNNASQCFNQVSFFVEQLKALKDRIEKLCNPSFYRQNNKNYDETRKRILGYNNCCNIAGRTSRSPKTKWAKWIIEAQNRTLDTFSELFHLIDTLFANLLNQFFNQNLEKCVSDLLNNPTPVHHHLNEFFLDSGRQLNEFMNQKLTGLNDVLSQCKVDIVKEEQTINLNMQRYQKTLLHFKRTYSVSKDPSGPSHTPVLVEEEESDDGVIVVAYSTRVPTHSPKRSSSPH